MRIKQAKQTLDGSLFQIVSWIHVKRKLKECLVQLKEWIDYFQIKDHLVVYLLFSALNNLIWNHVQFVW
jgi:hypothetical protein